MAMVRGLSVTTAALCAAVALHGAHAQYNAAPAQVGDVTMMGSSKFSWQLGASPTAQPSAAASHRLNTKGGHAKYAEGTGNWICGCQSCNKVVS